MLILAQAEAAKATWDGVLLGYGPLGVFAFLSAAAIGWGVREWWKVEKPHRIAKQKLELQQQEKAGLLYDTLRESEPAKIELQRQTVKLVEAVHANQFEHAGHCRSTDKTVEKVAPMIEKIAKHLGVE